MRTARRLPGLGLGLLLATACGTPPSTPPPDAGSGGGGGGGGGGGSDAGVTTYTWYRDVLPIVQNNCQGCHTEGGIGPFALETYEQAKAMHASMAAAVATRRMPPWMPDPSCNSYLDERRLTQEEIDTFVTWSEEQAPAGDPADAPAPPSKETLPWVDATLDAQVDYTPSTAAGPDDYHCFVLDPALTQSEDVIGFDIVPRVRSEVHHVLLYSVDKATADQKDAQTPEPGWTCFGGPGTGGNPAVVGGWVPGTPVTHYPEGTGIRLQANDALVMQIHYNTQNGPPEADRTVVKLQYAMAPVPKPALITPQAEAGFVIPPGAVGHSATSTSFALPALTLYGVLPHMHQLGRRIQMKLSPSDTCVVDIPAWDFHWQQFYMLKTPIQVPAGAQSVLTCTWDNPGTSSVTWGEETSQEMCLNYSYVTIP